MTVVIRYVGTKSTEEVKDVTYFWQDTNHFYLILKEGGKEKNRTYYRRNVRLHCIKE